MHLHIAEIQIICCYLLSSVNIAAVHPVTTAIPTLHPAKRQKTELDDAIGSYLINVTGKWVDDGGGQDGGGAGRILVEFF